MMIFRLSETPADWRLQSDRGRKGPVSHAISVKKGPSQTSLISVSVKFVTSQHVFKALPMIMRLKDRYSMYATSLF